MQSKLTLSDDNVKVNVFKITGKIIKLRITVLGDYRVIKLTNFKMKKKKYEIKTLQQEMENTGVKVKHHLINTKSNSLENEDDNFLLRQKVLQRMKSDANSSFFRTSHLKDNTAFLKEVTPPDENNFELDNSKNTLENPEQEELLNKGTLGSQRSNNGLLSSRNGPSRAVSKRSLNSNIPSFLANDQMSTVNDSQASKKKAYQSAGQEGSLDIGTRQTQRDSEEDKEYLKQKKEQKILTNYVQVLFKKVENLFTKDSFNKPNDNLKNAILIKNLLKILFYIIFTLLLLSIVYLKWFEQYRDQTKGLKSTTLVQNYHNSTLDTLERYFLLDLYNRNYFGALQHDDDIPTQRSRLNTSVLSIKGIIFEDNFRNALLYCQESQQVKSVKYDNSSINIDEKSYNMSLVELSTLFLNKIDLFLQTGNTENLEFFLLENFFQYINNYVLEKGELLFEIQLDTNKKSFNYDFAIFLICCVLYFAAFVLSFRLSGIITPCLNAIIVGFNFINEETLRKINHHLDVQINFLNELKM